MGKVMASIYSSFEVEDLEVREGLLTVRGTIESAEIRDHGDGAGEVINYLLDDLEYFAGEFDDADGSAADGFVDVPEDMVDEVTEAISNDSINEKIEEIVLDEYFSA